MEVYKMLPEGTLAELIEGSIYMSPSPNTNHQRITGKLYRLLSDFVEDNSLGEVFSPPYDVYLDEHSNAVQPEVIFVGNKNKRIIKKDCIHGVPDLLIEGLSKGNKNHDTVRKKQLYEKFGVREYWIVDPETKETMGYSLKNKIYIECGRYRGKIKSVLLDHEFNF
ncbi:MAG: Uma2 family endonuclease [Bacteroidota bacterium]